MKPEANLIWPKDMALTAYDRSTETIRFLTQASFLTMSASCVLHEGIASIDRLAEDEGVLDRVSMISITPNSFHRLFSKPLSLLGEYGQLVRKAYPPCDDRPLIIRGTLDGVDDELTTPARNPKTWYEGQSHRDLQVKSVIDYNLWNAAKWDGTVYTLPGPQLPPGLGIMFKDEAAGRAIFERWRERFGAIDREDEIYLSILRNVSDTEPAHYDVLLTSNHTLADAKRNGSAMVLSRYKRMEPATNGNLERFLADYDEAGVFLFFPAVMVNGEPRLLFDVAIMKRNLRVKSAKALTGGDIEQVCLGKRSSRPSDTPVEA